MLHRDLSNGRGENAENGDQDKRGDVGLDVSAAEDSGNQDHPLSFDDRFDTFCNERYEDEGTGFLALEPLM